MAAEEDWVSALAVEAEEQAAVAPQAGAAAPAVLEVCGRPANRARQPAVGRVAAVLAAVRAAGLVQVDLGVEVETAAEDLAVAAPVVEAARAAADQVEDLEVVDRVAEAEPEEAEELVAGLARPANRASGWPRRQCSREACWGEFRA